MMEGEKNIPIEDAAIAYLDAMPMLRLDASSEADSQQNLSLRLVRHALFPLAIDALLHSKENGERLTTPETLIEETLSRHPEFPESLVTGVKSYFKPRSAGQPRDWNREGMLILEKGIDHPLPRLSQHIVIAPQIGEIMMRISLRS